MTKIAAAIVDYGLGNLFSIKRACEVVGLSVEVTSDVSVMAEARSIILPGVGAFGDAMQSLDKLDLVSPLKDLAQSGKPFVGICLGQQLLFTESDEFGGYKGLDIIPGTVRYLPVQEKDGRSLKVPQVGWNGVEIPQGKSDDFWDNTVLRETVSGTSMYFVHSCYVTPDDSSAVLGETQYGDIRFCSAIQKDNILAFQFHPERSGEGGLTIYKIGRAHV